MTKKMKRKPLLWILVDLFGLIILQAGAFQYFKLDIPYITPFFASYSTTLLLSLGGIIILGSLLLFLIPLIKANKSPSNEKQNVVERSKR